MKKYSMIFSLLLLFGCGPTEDQRNIAEKAMEQIEACKGLGEDSIKIKGKCLVWSLKKNSLHSAHNALQDNIKYGSGGGSVTVFLISAEQEMLVGYYSISNKPGYRRWVDVYVVQYPEMKPIGIHEFVGFDPTKRRPVKYEPEYGVINTKRLVADWIESLPTETN
jgi:hypothetical protein